MNNEFARLFPLDFKGYEIYEPTQLAIINYYYHRLDPGSFVYNMLANNFVEACIRADYWTAQQLKVYAKWLNERMPTVAWGSYEKVNAWLEGRAANEI